MLTTFAQNPKFAQIEDSQNCTGYTSRQTSNPCPDQPCRPKGDALPTENAIKPFLPIVGAARAPEPLIGIAVKLTVGSVQYIIGITRRGKIYGTQQAENQPGCCL